MDEENPPRRTRLQKQRLNNCVSFANKRTRRDCVAPQTAFVLIICDAIIPGGIVSDAD
jgi:hypothetical protein